MRGSDTQLDQVQRLIDKIHHHIIHDASYHPDDFGQLQLLSSQIQYSYEKALVHAYLAQYAQVTMDAEGYHKNLEEAKSIARSLDYFDVLIKCAQLEGNRNSELCDEAAALSHYLEGLAMALETKDRKACFVFYREIAELFADCGAYEDAQAFHQKALNLLEEKHISDSAFYRKHIWLRLLRVSCIRGKLAQAEEYFLACQKEDCALGNLNLLFLVEQIRFLLLRGEEAAAVEKAKTLLHDLQQSENDPIQLQPVYLYSLELFLEIRWQEGAAWCLRRMDALYPEMNRKNAIRLQKMRVQYEEAFGLADDRVYRDFYEVTRQGEMANQVSIAEFYRSLIALYESAKEKNRMMEERSDLETAIDRDELTQIYNRRYYGKLISKLLQDDRISSLDCVMIDVDSFKAYNDHYGHPKGDLILKEVASLLVSCLPEGAFAARFGGDEFSCIFVDKTEEELVDFIQRVRSELSAKKIQHFKNRNGTLLTLSFGVYRETDLCHADEYQILSRADQALYQAKENGRNTYAVFEQGMEP